MHRKIIVLHIQEILRILVFNVEVRLEDTVLYIMKRHFLSIIQLGRRVKYKIPVMKCCSQ